MFTLPTLSNQRKINIVKLMIVEAGTYNPQYLRPYQSVITPDVITAVKTKIDAENSVDPAVISGVMSGALFPSVAPEVDANGVASQIHIANGWQEPRFRFIMEVEIDDGIVKKTELVQGASTHLDFSRQSGFIAPDLEFKINSVATLKHMRYNTPTGQVQGVAVVGANHMLSNTYYSGMDQSGFRSDNLYHMRPTDIYSLMQHNHVEEHIEINTTGLMTDTPELAARANNVPSVYASRVLDGMRKAQIVDSVQLGTDMGNRTQVQVGDNQYSIAKRYVQEQVATEVTFLTALAQLHGMGAADRFSLNELRRIDPNVDNVTLHTMIAPAARQELPNVGNSEYWHGQDGTTHVAAILGSVVPSLMVECGITMLGFTATNRTVNGEIIVTPTAAPVGFVQGVDVSRPFDAFRINLITRCLQAISMNGLRDFQINVVANLMGSSSFSIALDGNHYATPYVQPTFTDALMSPIVTQNRLTSRNLASDLEYLVNETVAPQTQGYASTQFGF